jgi:hypothetical protein
MLFQLRGSVITLNRWDNHGKEDENKGKEGIYVTGKKVNKTTLNPDKSAQK